MPITKDVVKFGTFVVTSQVCAHPDALLAVHCVALTPCGEWRCVVNVSLLLAYLLTIVPAGLPPDAPVIRRSKPQTAASGPCAGIAAPRRTAIQ